MRRRLALVAILFLAAAAPLAAAEKPRPPARIASLNLAADEILIELIDPHRLVTVTSFADDPASSNIVGRVPPKVARVTRAKMERLVELAPDLVVVSEYSEADFLHLLTTSKMAYHRVVVRSLDDVSPAIRALGEAVGAEDKAAELAARFEASLAILSRRLEGARRPRVLHWNEPYTAGRGTVLSDIIERAGAINVAAELGVTGFAPLPAERAFASDPDFVLITREGKARAGLLAHPMLSRLAAVRKGRIIEMPGPLHATLTHHTAAACELLARAFHPKRFRDAP